MYVAAKKLSRKNFLGTLLISILLALAFFTAPTQAQTELTATICNADGPVINLTNPASDSVINQRTTPVTGSVLRTSQVDIYLNNDYVESVAIGLDEQLNTTLTLHEGTNTIRFDMFYSCNQTQASQSVAVTYRPDASTSTARPSTRTIPAGDTAPGQVSNPEQLQEGDQGIIERIQDNLTFTDSYVRPAGYWIATLLAFLFACVALLPPSYLIALFGLFGWKNKKFSVGLQIVIRVIAAVAAIIFATIVQA